MAKMNVSNFAQRQLQKMGWKEGEGLGKTSSGIKTNIKVQKKTDDKGIGCHRTNDVDLNYTNSWWNDNISNTLQRLSKDDKNKKKRDRKKKKKDSSNGSNSDLNIISTPEDEIFAATGGLRIGMHHGNRRRVSLLSTKTTTSDKKDGDDTNTNKFEWNGLDDAKIILSSSKDNKKTKEVNVNDKLESKKSKKEKKKDKKRKRKYNDDDKGESSNIISSEDDEKENSKRRKKSKKEAKKNKRIK